MRILLTADTVGGVWDYTCTLARALHEEGHDVLVAVLGEAGDRHSRLPPGVEVAARLYRLEWMPDSAEDVAASNAWISRLARLWEADVVHLNQFSAALAEFGVPSVVVAHSDVLSWFGETLGAPATEGWAEYAARVRAALRRATVVVAPTEYQSRLLGRHYGRAADRVIHNGIVARPRPSGDREPLVVCAARAWDAAKGIGTLDEAAGRLGSAGSPIHLLGETESPRGERLQARHVISHGAVERAEVDRWMERASIYVSPSFYEPFGLAPLEAALNGCALLLSDIGSFRELWDGCAEFFPPGDSARLAEGLAALGEDRDRVSRLAAAARRRAVRRYTAEGMTRGYTSLYSELTTGRLPRRLARPVHQPA